MEKRWNELTAELRRLEGRLALAEQASQSGRKKHELTSAAERHKRPRFSQSAVPCELAPHDLTLAPTSPRQRATRR